MLWVVIYLNLVLVLDFIYEVYVILASSHVYMWDEYGFYEFVDLECL